MESNEQNGISGALKLIIFTAIYLLINFVLMVPECTYKNLESTKVSKEAFNVQTPTEGNEFAMDESTNDDEASMASVFKQSSTSAFNVKINGYAVTLTDNTFGYISSIKDRYSVLQGICNTYIRELGLDAKNISEIDIYGKIEATAQKERVSNLEQSGEVSKQIYDAAVINDDLSGLQVKIKLTEQQIVEPDIVTENTNELYMGESTQTQGEEGKSIVYKELVYNGLEKSAENILSEDIIKPAVNSVIKIGTKNPYNDGIAFLVRPTNGGYISSNFGEQRAKSVHKGIDIAKNYGENVMASLEGKVISAGYNNGGYGNLIIIEHANNMKTYYAHLSKIYVNQGDEVKKDQVIGAIGSTGNSTGPHLHFELRVNESPVNPIDYIMQ